MNGTVLQDAIRVSESLEAIRRVIRAAIWAEARRLPVPLTPPQILALQVLADHLRASGSGLSLSELAQRMGLAHSTVSGIVGRLAERGLVQRATDPSDRRFSRIELGESAAAWVRDDLPGLRLRPLIETMKKATGHERASILAGLAALERLLLPESPDSPERPLPESPDSPERLPPGSPEA